MTAAIRREMFVEFDKFRPAPSVAAAAATPALLAIPPPPPPKVIVPPFGGEVALLREVYVNKRTTGEHLMKLGEWCAYPSDHHAELRSRLKYLDEDTRAANVRYNSERINPNADPSYERTLARIDVLRQFGRRMNAIFEDLEPLMDHCIDSLDLNTADELLHYVSRNMTHARIGVIKRAYSERYSGQTLAIRMCRNIMRACRKMAVHIYDPTIVHRYEKLMVGLVDKFAEEDSVPNMTTTSMSSSSSSMYAQPPSVSRGADPEYSSSTPSTPAQFGAADDASSFDEDISYAMETYADIMCPTNDLLQEILLADDEADANALLQCMNSLVCDCMSRMRITDMTQFFIVTASVTAMRMYERQMQEDSAMST